MTSLTMTTSLWRNSRHQARHRADQPQALYTAALEHKICLSHDRSNPIPARAAGG